MFALFSCSGSKIFSLATSKSQKLVKITSMEYGLNLEEQFQERKSFTSKTPRGTFMFSRFELVRIENGDNHFFTGILDYSKQAPPGFVYVCDLAVLSKECGIQINGMNFTALQKRSSQ